MKERKKEYPEIDFNNSEDLPVDIDQLEEDDEINSREAGFMRGYEE